MCGVGVMVLWCDGVIYWIKIFLLIIVEIVCVWVVCLYVCFNYCFKQWIDVGFGGSDVYWVIIVVIVVFIYIVSFGFVVVGQVVEVVLVFQIGFLCLVIEIQCIVMDVVYVVDQ